MPEPGIPGVQLSSPRAPTAGHLPRASHSIRQHARQSALPIAPIRVLMSPVGRQEEAIRVAEELLADIELERLKASEIVLKASRVARLVGHDDLLAFLALERNGYSGDSTESEWIDRAGRRSDEEDKFYSVALPKVEANLNAAREALKTLQGGGNYSGEWASIAGREHDGRIAAYSKIIGLWAGICGQVVATIYDMVVEVYHELMFSELQATLFADTQMKVDGALAAASGTALNKIERVSDRLRDGDPESVSQALTTCRRLIDSSADYLFPAARDQYEVDGQPLKVWQQNVLNRLQAYAHSHGASKGRRDRLRRTLSDLYERCSAGTHAEVSVQEARFVVPADLRGAGRTSGYPGRVGRATPGDIRLLHEGFPTTQPSGIRGALRRLSRRRRWWPGGRPFHLSAQDRGSPSASRGVRH